MEDGRSLYGRYQVYMDATQEIFQRMKYKSVFFNLTEFSV